MKQTILFTQYKAAVLAGIVLTLSACGSGGGSETNADATPTPPAAGKPVEPAKPAASITGQAALSGNRNIEAAAAVSGSDLDTLVVNGQSISLVFGDANEDIFREIHGTDINAVSGTHLQSLRYGMVKAGDKHALFAQGMPSASVPDGGIVRYSGYFIHHDAAASSSVVSRQNTANFTVDFDDKTLTGTLTNPVAGANGQKLSIELAAKINGNTFEGEKNGTLTRGGFYGADAAELGGVYVNANGKFGGSFGAKQK